MIVRPRVNWLRMMFVWHGSVLGRILPQLGLILVISSVAVLTDGRILGFKIQLNLTPFTLIGVAIALFLGFRNNASYDRYWEARRLWGALLNDARSLARQARSLTHPALSPAATDRFIFSLIALVHALRHQLQRTDSTFDLNRLLPPEFAQRVAAAKYQPVVILDSLGQWVRTQREESMLDPISAAAIDQNLSNLSTIIGGCERIAGTPLPLPYVVMIHRSVYIYCLLLPYGLVDSIGWMTPVMAVFVAYAYLALEELAGQLETPFDGGPNGVALQSICRTIESSLLELMGRAPLADVPIPADYVVL